MSCMTLCALEYNPEIENFGGRAGRATMRARIETTIKQEYFP